MDEKTVMFLSALLTSRAIHDAAETFNVSVETLNDLILGVKENPEGVLKEIRDLVPDIELALIKRALKYPSKMAKELVLEYPPAITYLHEVLTPSKLDKDIIETVIDFDPFLMAKVLIELPLDIALERIISIKHLNTLIVFKELLKKKQSEALEYREKVKEFIKQYPDNLQKHFSSIARKISTPYFSARILAAISRELYTSDPKKAEIILQQATRQGERIKYLHDKIRTLSAIASEIIETMPEQARAILTKVIEMANSIKDESERSRALAEISMELAKTSFLKSEKAFYEANKFVSKIKEKFYRLRATATIACEVSKIDLAKSRKMLSKVLKSVKKIRDRRSKFWIKDKIVKSFGELSYIDPSLALELINGIKDDDIKVDILRALISFYETFDKLDPEKLLLIAENIKYDLFRSTIIDIVVRNINEIARSDPERAEKIFLDAINVIRKMDDDLWIFGALDKVTDGLIKNVPENVDKMFIEAFKVALKRKNDYWKNMTISLIIKKAQKLGKVDPEKAILTTEKLKKEFLKAHVVSSVVESIKNALKNVDWGVSDFMKDVVSIAGEAMSASRTSEIIKAQILASAAEKLMDEDPEKAKDIFHEASEIARKTKDKYNKSLLLAHIANNLVRVDRERAEELFLEAIKTANKIGNKYDKFLALVEIAGDLAEIAPMETQALLLRALKFAGEISESDLTLDKLGSAINIAKSIKELTELELEKIGNVFSIVTSIIEEIENIRKPNLQRDRFLRAVTNSIKKLAKVDWKRAIEIAEKLSDDVWRDDVLKAIAIELANVDIDKAIEFAERIKKDYRRDETLGMLATIVAEKDMDRAIEIIVEKMDDDYKKVKALKPLLINIAKIDLDKAIMMSRKIETNKARDELLKAIAIEVAKIDLNKALTIVNIMYYSSTKTEFTFSIMSKLINKAKELIDKNPNAIKNIIIDAIEITKLIDDYSDKEEARNIITRFTLDLFNKLSHQTKNLQANL